MGDIGIAADKRRRRPGKKAHHIRNGFYPPEEWTAYLFSRTPSDAEYFKALLANTSQNPAVGEATVHRERMEVALESRTIPYRGTARRLNHMVG
jgi:hypothetical protein